MTEQNKGNISQDKQANIDALEAAKKALEAAEKAVATIEEDKTHRLTVSHATLVGAITSASLSRRYALQVEFGAGLALFLSEGGTSREAKQALMGIYSESGYDCKDSSGGDYTTLSRRINTTAKLFDHIGYDVVDGWCAGTADMLTVNTIVGRIEPLGLKSINATLAYVGKPVLPKLPEQHTVEQKGDFPQQHTVSTKGIPDGQIVPQMSEEDNYKAWLKRRGGTPLEKEWEIEAGFKRIETEHIIATITPEATKDEIVKIAMQLLEIAQGMDGEGQPDTRGGSGGEYHEPENGDDRGNRAAVSVPEKSGNVAVAEAMAPPEINGNVPPKPKASRYRAAPKK